MHSKNLLQNRRPDVYKLLNDLGCRFKYVDEIYLDDLIIDQGIYPRESTDWERVKMYAENLENGAEFPPILIVERESDFKKIILDGNHRYYAHKEIDKDKIVAEVWEVPESLYPVVAQAVNTEEKEIDTPLTPVEKKKAILRDWEILTHYDKETRREIIAKILKTSVAYVNKVLSEAGLIRSEKEELKKKVIDLCNQGLTQTEIAKMLGINQATVSRILKDYAKFTQVKNRGDYAKFTQVKNAYPEDFSKFTQVKNEKNEEEPQTEPDWSDWNEEQATEESQEKPKKKNKKDKLSEYLTPTQLLERRKNDIWDIVIELEFHFGTDTALEILEEIYFAFKEKKYKDMEIYKDRKALFLYNRR